MIIFDGAASTTNKPVRDDYPPIKYYYIMILLSTNPKSLIFFQKYSNWYHWAFSEHDGKAEVCCSGLSGINLWKGQPHHFYERLFVSITFNPLPLHVLIWSYLRDRSWVLAWFILVLSTCHRYHTGINSNKPCDYGWCAMRGYIVKTVRAGQEKYMYLYDGNAWTSVRTHIKKNYFTWINKDNVKRHWVSFSKFEVIVSYFYFIFGYKVTKKLFGSQGSFCRFVKQEICRCRLSHTPRGILSFHIVV